MKVVWPQMLALPILGAASFAPLTASAQGPSYATRTETITGTIASVQNVNHLFVADDRGYTDDVTLRAGAAVFSNGVRLEPGARVTIKGSAAGPTFLATRIATSGPSDRAVDPPAATAYPVPVPDYYPAPLYYPAPVYYYGAYFRFRPYFYGYGRHFGGYRPFYRGYRPIYGPYRGYRSVSVGGFFHRR